jgi:hypothetical protein
MDTGASPHSWKMALLVALALLALVVVLGLLAAGAALNRWWPVAGFLVVGNVGILYQLTTGFLARRRAERLPASSVPWDVPLDRPLWLNESLPYMGSSALVGAIPAALGFPAVGVGLVVALVGLFGVATAAAGRTSVTRLRFAKDELWAGSRHVWIRVPWQAIVDVRHLGPECMRLKVARADALRIEPDSARARWWARFLVLDSWITLDGWAGGLDRRTIERAIAQGRGGSPEAPN